MKKIAASQLDDILPVDISDDDYIMICDVDGGHEAIDWKGNPIGYSSMLKKIKMIDFLRYLKTKV